MNHPYRCIPNLTQAVALIKPDNGIATASGFRCGSNNYPHLDAIVALLTQTSAPLTYHYEEDAIGLKTTLNPCQAIPVEAQQIFNVLADSFSTYLLPRMTAHVRHIPIPAISRLSDSRSPESWIKTA
ncbi:MAG: hypothetical protein M1820_009246 [Bogoriella megaspora]|nr:MAG: hypothetical protein M1820_009246 [Bogoriella megaspora]